MTPSMMPATPPRGAGRPFTVERLAAFRHKVDLQHEAGAEGPLLEHLESQYAAKRSEVAEREGVSEAEIDARVARQLGRPVPGEGAAAGGEPVPEDELVADDDAVIGRAVRWSLVALAALAAVALVIFLVARGGEPERAERVIEAAPPEAVEPAGAVPALPFADVNRAAGVRFERFSGATGEKLLPETMGGGGAFFDHDGDGDADLLLVNGAPWPWAARRTAEVPTQALYRNDGAGRFTDVTAETGLDLVVQGQGVAVGDYDGDGDPDLYLTAVGENRLLENRGGRYVDVTARSGAGGGEAWSTGAAFFDADADGDLDLFVANYVQWSRAIDFEVDYRLTGVGRAYGPPMNYRGAHSKLFRNEGGGRFTDVSAEAGIEVVNPATGEPAGKALAVLPVDVDLDGHLDLLVANDTVGNFFFHNRGDGTFVEDGTVRGLAFDRMGRATGAMGVDAGWFRNDAELGFLIGNFANEMSSVYVSQGDPELFADEAIPEGVGAPSRSALSFGMLLLDVDLDGRLDLLQTNGHLEEEIAAVDPSQSFRQPAQLFWNAGPEARATFVEVPREATGDLARPLVGRGSATADLDGDGDLDVALFQPEGPPLLLENRQQLGHHWLRVKLVGSTAAGSNGDAIGAVVEATAGGVTQRRQVNPTRSYLSQSELPLTFGLGDADRVERLEITWPSGERQVLEDVPADRLLVVEEGKPAP